MLFKLDSLLALAWQPFTPAVIAACLPLYTNKYISTVIIYSPRQRRKPTNFKQKIIASFIGSHLRRPGCYEEYVLASGIKLLG